MNKFKLPTLANFIGFINSFLKDSAKFSSDRKHTIISNTPLYRLYVENNKFETLNMIKPIKLVQRKEVDISA